MKIETLHIFPQDENAHLITYIRDNPPELANKPRRAILICPGGGYQWTSDRENEPIAIQFLARGYNVFVLKYSVAEMAKDLNPLREIELSIKHIRDNAEEYNINPQKVYVIGFSAGGHLALATGLMAENKPDAIEDTNLMLDLKGEIQASPAVYKDMLVIGTCSKDNAYMYGIRIE